MIFFHFHHGDTPPSDLEEKNQISTPGNLAYVPRHLSFHCHCHSVEAKPVFLHCLGGGFKYFLCSPLFGEDSHFDSYFSKGLKPPTSCDFIFIVILVIWHDDTNCLLFRHIQTIHAVFQKVTIFGNNPFISFLIHTTHPTQQRSHTSASPRSLYTSTSRTFDRWRKMDGSLAHLKKLGGGNSNIFYVHPENWGRRTHFDSYVSKGLVKNHQPENDAQMSFRAVQEQRASEEEERFHEEDPTDSRSLFGCFHYCQGCNLGDIGNGKMEWIYVSIFFREKSFTDKIFELRLVSQDAFWLFREFGWDQKMWSKKGLRRHLHAHACVYILFWILDIIYNSKMGNGYTDIVVHT